MNLARVRLLRAFALRPLAAAAALLFASPALAVYQCGNVKDDCQCGANNPYPCCSNGGNCTWYAWEAACCAWGVGLPGWGNANQWAGNARANASYKVLSYPVTDAVSCRASGTYGHVAFVVALNSASSITVHEENCWGGYGWDTANYSPGYFDGGYIVRAGQTACRPGDSQTQSCGACGTQSRGCGNDGAWGGWGACSGQGACTPGQTDSKACGTCGSETRTCNSSCQWDAYGSCSGPDPAPAQAVCATGKKGACAYGRLRCVAGDLSCEETVQPKAEVCNGIDDDCNGVVDDGSVCPKAPPAPGGGGRQVRLLKAQGCGFGSGPASLLSTVFILLALSRRRSFPCSAPARSARRRA